MLFFGYDVLYYYYKDSKTWFRFDMVEIISNINECCFSCGCICEF